MEHATAQDTSTQLIKQTRLYMSTTIIAAALLAPVFTFGYVQGKRSGEPMGSRVVSASTQSAKSAESTPQKSAIRPTLPSVKERKAENPVAAKPATEPREASERQVYLQIAAGVAQQTSQMLAQLRSKGFSVSSTDVPSKPGMERVLVGPLADSEISATRAELQRQGFPGESAIKRVF